MTSVSTQARKRRRRRLRRSIDRLVFELHQKWNPVAGKLAPDRVGGGPATMLDWEAELNQLYEAEVAAGGRGAAADWLIAVVRAAAPIDAEFHSQMIAAASDLGVFVPTLVHSVRTLGPRRRAPVISNALRVAWAHAR